MSADLSKQATALLHFTNLRLKAAELLEQAERLPDLPPVCRAQAHAAHFFAGVHLHRVGSGMATPADAVALRDDLLVIARRGVDPLIEALGEHAASNFNGIDVALFKAQLEGALDGNATYELDTASEHLAIDQAEDGHDDGERSDFEEHHTLHKAGV